MLPRIGPPEHGPRPHRFSTGAWVLYDLANTVYAATLTFLFTPFVEKNYGGLSNLGLTQTWSMVLAGLLVPVLGAIVDRTARTGLYLSIATLLCIGAMSGWGLGGGEGFMLGCFFLANVAYNLGLLFYNSLLPSVASHERAGLISGIGVGVGYCGTILVLLLLLPVKTPSSQFLLAAGMFLVFALPCMCLVRDRREVRKGPATAAVRDALASLLSTLKELPQHRALLYFLLANFCLVDVLNTAVLFFGSFTRNVFATAAEDGSLVLFGTIYRGQEGLDSFFALAGLCLNSMALVFGISLGALTDRWPLRVMKLSGLALLFALVGGAWFGGTSALGYLLTLVMLGSLGLSGIWTAGRKVVVLLAPKERIGEFFGLYGITVKLSVIGSTVYGLVADGHGAKSAMLVQSVQLLVGLGLLALVRLPQSGDAARAA